MPVLKPQALTEERVDAIRMAHHTAKLDRAELDLSGGIDSAVMAGLLVKALGPGKVTLVHSILSTNPVQTARARAIASALGCPLTVIDLDDIYNVLVENMTTAIARSGACTVLDIVRRVDTDPTILGSVRSTLRAPVGRACNRLMGGGIRHGTGNEDEDRWLRFYQKGGDGEVDSNPLAFLSKGEVYQLAFALGQTFPQATGAYTATIEATPSPDLWGTGNAHSDESELEKWLGAPFTYSRIDPDTGEYKSVGTIERVSRFLDHAAASSTVVVEAEKLLFGKAEPYWDQTVTFAVESGLFDGFSRTDVVILLKGARKAEAATRHKLNPNIPTYGSRADLVHKGILTDELPSL